MTATVAIGYSDVNALQLFDDHREFAKLAAANRHSQEQGAQAGEILQSSVLVGISTIHESSHRRSNNRDRY